MPWWAAGLTPAPRICDWSVHFWPAGGDAVVFPRAGLPDHTVNVGGGRIDFAVENRLLPLAGFGQFGALAIHNL
jgi:hypothetical protein